MKKLVALVVSLWISLFVVAGMAHAGTNLTVTCPAIGACTISPAGTPLFDESGWVPGSTVTQYFRMSNTSAQNGFAAVEVQNYSETKNLGEVINIEIRRGSPLGPVIYNGVTLHQFRDDGYFTIDGMNAGQTTDYFVVATMQSTAGNSYQGAHVIFDLNMGLEITPIPPQSGGGDGAGNPGGGTSPPGPASPPVCTATPPSSAPSVTITNVGTNTVTLSWTSVSPVTHYGLFFTRTSDGAEYGAPNVGNVNSYTITNLSGGANYSFQVFGVNDCAPGPRSGAAGSGLVPGPFIAARPIGAGGQVLGVATEASPSPEPSPSPSPTPSPLGQVAGAAIEACARWRFYIPWILLIAQAAFIAATEYYFRRDARLTKYFFSAGITLASIALFYWLRECDCYGRWSWLVWLCRWYWVVSLLLTLLLRLFSYAFVEETEEVEERPKKVATPEAKPKTDL